MILRLRDEGTRRFFKFALVGLSGYLVNGLLLEVFSRMPFIRALAGNFSFLRSTVLAFLSQQSGWASVLSMEGSILSNFLWNSVWTFRSSQAPTPGSAVKRLLAFNLTSVGAMLIQAFAVGSATRLLIDSTLVRQFALVATIGLLVLPYNWLVYNRLIWRKPRTNT
jgi:putative flippase GtrA